MCLPLPWPLHHRFQAMIPICHSPAQSYPRILEKLDFQICFHPDLLVDNFLHILPPPPTLSSLTFSRPTRRILSPQDHQIFLASDTYNLLLSFIFSLTESVQDKKISDIRSEELSPIVKAVLKILDEVEGCVRSCPPEDQGGSRFGNPAFRVFLDKIAQESGKWGSWLGINDEGAREEAGTYFKQAFGNRTRIDYGSGHELNFVVWLYVLHTCRMFKIRC